MILVGYALGFEIYEVEINFEWKQKPKHKIKINGEKNT